MADVNQVNRVLVMKKHERDKLIAQSQILSREIRIEELKEEIGRCEFDIEQQLKLIVVAEQNLEQQRVEVEKEKTEKANKIIIKV